MTRFWGIFLYGLFEKNKDQIKKKFFLKHFTVRIDFILHFNLQIFTHFIFSHKLINLLQIGHVKLSSSLL